MSDHLKQLEGRVKETVECIRTGYERGGEGQGWKEKRDKKRKRHIALLAWLILNQYHRVNYEHCFACIYVAEWNLFLNIIKPGEFSH
jgi:hypothetical protein